jgi:hypothetical protein
MSEKTPPASRAAPKSTVRDDVRAMSEDKPHEILGGLPRTRPHRRSDKRGAARPSNGRGTAKTSGGSGSKPAGRNRSAPLRQPKQPRGTPPKPASRRPAPPTGPQIVSTVVRAAAELAEIGLSAGSRAFRDALGRIPRP